MLRKPPEPHAARWHNFPHLEKYFSALKPPADPMDGWPAAGYERAREEEKYLRQLLSSFLHLDTLNQPSPDPADLKSIARDLDTLARMCDHFAGMHESEGRELRAMRCKVSEMVSHWLLRG